MQCYLAYPIYTFPQHYLLDWLDMSFLAQNSGTDEDDENETANSHKGRDDNQSNPGVMTEIRTIPVLCLTSEQSRYHS